MSIFAYYNFQFTKLKPGPMQVSWLEALPEPPDVENNFKRKQEIFSELLQGDCDGTRPITFASGGRNSGMHGHQWLMPFSDDMAVLRIQNRRTRTVETKDFQEERREEYPSCVVVIDNRAGIQRIVIERRGQAFGDPNQVSEIIKKTFSKLLRPYGLGISVDRLHTRDAFWKVALDTRAYPLGFKKIRFHLPPLNLERLLEALHEYQNLSRRMFGGTDFLQEQSAPRGGRLVFDENDPEQEGLIAAMTEQVGGDGTIELYPNGKKQGWVPIGKDNYRTSELSDKVIASLESDDETERLKAMDEMKRFTKKFIEL